MLFINNEWVLGDDESLSSVNPATKQDIWQARAASIEQVDEAFIAARKASLEWMTTKYEQRIKYIQTFNDHLEKQKEDLAEVISIETGKPLWEAKTEVGAMLNKLDVSIKAFTERCPEKKNQNGKIISITRHKPHGVVSVLGPFNFPAHLPNGHIIPALLAGNTVVFKPSELTPLVSEKVMHIWQQADLPKGVLNMLHGKSEVGKQMVNHPEVDGIFFTGSAKTGLQIQSSLIEEPRKIIALEMGGNNPLIVSDVAREDIDSIVYNIIQSAFITSGQRCTCARRLYIVKSMDTDRLLASLVEAIKNIKVGHYTDTPEPFMGTLISADAAFNVYSKYKELVASGAKELVGMQDPNGLAFLNPSILDLTNSKQIVDQEIFGPLLQLMVVNNLEQAIKHANMTSYGLSAGILTNNKDSYNEFYTKIRAGIVNWNRPLTGASSVAPFGGLGQSGNHRPSAYYAADYCSYPVASLEEEQLSMPDKISPGIKL